MKTEFLSKRHSGNAPGIDHRWRAIPLKGRHKRQIPGSFPGRPSHESEMAPYLGRAHNPRNYGRVSVLIHVVSPRRATLR
jgi:hypothetical protein